MARSTRELDPDVSALLLEIWTKWRPHAQLDASRPKSTDPKYNVLFVLNAGVAPEGHVFWWVEAFHPEKTGKGYGETGYVVEQWRDGLPTLPQFNVGVHYDEIITIAPPSKPPSNLAAGAYNFGTLKAAVTDEDILARAKEVTDKLTDALYRDKALRKAYDEITRDTKVLTQAAVPNPLDKNWWKSKS